MRNQLGMTLIELMVAAVLGIVLMTGVITLSITVNRSVDISDNLSRNQENGRFIMDYLTRYIRQAGYADDSTNTPLSMYVLGNTARHCQEAFITACALDDRAMTTEQRKGINGDRIALPFFASTNVTACTGEIVNGNQTFVNVFWVNDKKQLLCRVFNASKQDWVNDDGTSTTIIDGIEMMHVQLGVAGDKSDKHVTKYISIDANIDMNLIRSIRISILVNSTDPLDNDNNAVARFDKKSYGLLDSTPVSFTDGNLRHIFANTIDLPNAIAAAK